MLEELRIRRLGVIEDAELHLGPGLTVLTGETGAGKTMVLSALALLLGGRADPGAIRADSDQAEVEGVVYVGGVDPVVARVAEAGAALDQGRLVVARTVAAEGRSRAWLGGRAVPSTVLAEIADDLVAVHGQSTQVALARPERQRRLLDSYAGAASAAARQEVARLHQRLGEVQDELATLRTQAQQRAEEADLLRHGLDEIGAAAPEPGEEQRLAEEEARLAHADRLRASVGSAHLALAGDDLDPSGQDLLTLLAAARHALDAARGLDPTLGAAADRLAEVGYGLVDVATELSRYLDDLDVDPRRLAAVADRRAALAVLLRRYGPDLPAVLAWAEQAADRLALLDDDEGRLAALQQQRSDLRARLGQAAGALSAIRREAADRLAAAVTAELHALAMPTATVQITLEQRETPDGISVDGFPGRRLACSATGVDQVTFALSAYRGAPRRPLGKAASGGELSRTMLALEVVLAAADPVPTLVFDEVDAGVGGRAAVEVGRRLARLGRHAQVIVVTHLPQVAAFADRHYVVHRDTAGQVTRAGVHRVEHTERAAELARMMAGLEASDVALRHAGELLEAADAERHCVA